MEEPNGFAFLVLFAALPLGVTLFFALRPTIAALCVVLVGTMFLPEQTQLDLPAVPPIGKSEILVLACLLGVLLRAPGRLAAARPLRGPEWLVLAMFVGAVGTSLTNTDPLRYPPNVELPALTLYEAASVMLDDAVTYLLPFLIGRALFTTARDLKLLLSALAIAGAMYTPFLFVEMMMSPQLHHWIYGFHQHEFLQTMRAGGYRPMVFMAHGLVVALFMAWATIAAITLVKARRSAGPFPASFVGIYDFGFLAACKSLGAFLYATAALPLFALLRPRSIARVCALLAVVVFSYPVMRATEVFPEKDLVSLARAASGDRAQSLEFRFDMERLLMNHAKERPLFGWGRHKRNMLFSEWDGRPISVSDGHWIVVYSIRGGWGFVCVFALLLAPLFALRRRLRRIDDPQERVMLAGLGLIVAFSAVDLLPNGLHGITTVFLCGALWGVARGMSASPGVATASPP